MHHQRPRLGLRHQPRTDLVMPHLRQAKRRLLLLAHAHPDVGVKHIGALCRVIKVVRHKNIPGVQALQQLPGRLELLRRRNPQLEPELRSRPDPGTRHITRPVAHKRDDLALHRSERLADGLEVGQDLAGMLRIGQRVDGRDPAQPRKILHVFLGKRPNHRPVQHAPHHPRRVGDRLPAPELDVVGGKKHHVPAQLPDPDLETDPGPRGRLAENEPPTLVPQGMLRMAAPIGLHLHRQIEDFVNLSRGHRLDGKQMFHRKFQKNGITPPPGSPTGPGPCRRSPQPRRSPRDSR